MTQQTDFFVKPKVATKTVTIEFDGGTPCNIPRLGYGIGYGSFRINGGQVHRCNHERPMSANAAEVFTLVRAVQAVISMYPRHNVSLIIIGDSRIALRWASAGKKIAKGSSEEFRNAIQSLRLVLRDFPPVETRWQPRLQSVETFGH